MKLSGKRKIRSRRLSVFVLVALVSSMMHAMAFQANVYTVSDGISAAQVRTFSDSPEVACAMAGFDMRAYAIISDSGEGASARTLTVEKTFPVSLRADGETKAVFAVTQTVEEVLASHGVFLSADDMVFPARGTVLTEAMADSEITVTRVRYMTRTFSEEIPYETETRTTEALNYGQSRVVQEGAAGTRDLTYKSTFYDGALQAYDLIEERVSREPQPEIVEIGTAGAVVTRGGEVLRYSRVYDMRATAYSTIDGGSRTAMGTQTRVGAVAVDPKVIPLGSKLYITSEDGSAWIYGTAVAEDTGGAIKGNKIDLFFNTQQECFTFGVKSAKVYVLS